jgi:hypothetical protein
MHLFGSELENLNRLEDVDQDLITVRSEQSTAYRAASLDRAVRPLSPWPEGFQLVNGAPEPEAAGKSFW